MVSFDKNTTNRVSGLRKFAIIALLFSIAPTVHPASAQDHFYGSSTTSLESSMNWPWWHRIYFQANGSPRYASGFALSTRNTQNRLPVNPPICGPSYGYFQPCWKQIAVVRRCVTCETFPSNREIPNSNPPQSPVQIPEVPPAPEETESKDEAIPKEEMEKTEGLDEKGADNSESEIPQPIPSP